MTFDDMVPQIDAQPDTAMHFRADDLDADRTYKLLAGSVVPRPIAWITTLGPRGAVNAAPFSAFMYATHRPPTILFSIGRRDNGRLKDTGLNIERNGEFVVNFGHQDLVPQIHLSSNNYPEDISEADALGLETLPSIQVETPRLAVAPISFECRFDRFVEIGDDRAMICFGRVVHFHVRDEIIHDGKIDPQQFKPVGRIGGLNYVKLGDIIKVPPNPPL